MIAGVTGVVVVGASAGAYASMRGSGPSYRTAVVTAADVAQTMRIVGTVTPVSQASVKFASSGTVDSVDVSEGQKVTAGQRLGSLDGANLTAAVTSAKSTLATAQQTLSDDEATQAAAVSSSSTSSSTSQHSGTTGGSATAALARQQKALLSASAKVAQDLQSATSALGAAATTCGLPASTGPSGPSTGPSGPRPRDTASPEPSDSASPAPSASPSAAAVDPSACLAAEQSVIEAQQSVAADQRSQAALVDQLDRTVQQAVQQASQAVQQTSRQGSQFGSSGASKTVTAATLLVDAASINEAQANLDEAQQQLDQATILSPITGTVVAVGATKGSSISSSTTAFEISGLDEFQVDATITVDALSTVKVGQTASVAVDGVKDALTGTVVKIGLVPSSSSSSSSDTSSTTYPITIGLDAGSAILHQGGIAVATITTKDASGVMTVPTSAIHRTATATTVNVLKGGKSVPTVVTLGAIGTDRAQVLSGLTAGQVVILADLKAAVPSSSTTQRFTGGGLGGGLGGTTTVRIPGSGGFGGFGGGTGFRRAGG